MTTWSKHWQDPKRAFLLNEDVWFKKHQGLMLNIANTDFGRDLLCIDKNLPKIVRFYKNAVHCDKGNEFIADFRVGAKWANVIRTRWSEFNSYARYFLFERPIHMSPLTRQTLSLVNATLTAYPDPDPETTTIDGFVYHSAANWATVQGAASGTTANSVAANGIIAEANGATGANEITRGFTLFDTSTLGAGATISAGVYSLYITAITNQDVDAQDYIKVYTTTPASNTALVTDDYDQIGTTAQSGQVDFDTATTSAYNDLTLNATGRSSVSLTGVTKFGVREGHDAENSAINADQLNRLTVDFADQTGTGTDPKLVITYTAGGGPANLLLLHVG